LTAAVHYFQLSYVPPQRTKFPCYAEDWGQEGY